MSIWVESNSVFYLMANEAHGDNQAVLDMYQGQSKFLNQPKKSEKDENDNNVMPTYPLRHDVIRCELLFNLKDYETAEANAKAGLKQHGSDSWPFLLTLCMIASEKQDRLEPIREYIEGLVAVEEEKTEKRFRGPYSALES